jgi:hypothetical protein
MATVRLNIILDEDLYRRIKRQLPPKRLSAFINEAVRARLSPDVKALDAAYRAASRKKWRQRLGREWESTEIFRSRSRSNR